MTRPILDALNAFSLRIGADPLLTQAAGGNTSMKQGDVMWIKASGTWLAHALERDIFTPVSLPRVRDAVANEQPEAELPQEFTIPEVNASGLRPSIETTVHALLPQRVVAHVHCVDTIALAIREDAPELFAEILGDLNWAYVPYRRPGLPLARGIAAHAAQRPDVLILGNHGLVVAADTVGETEDLLRRVKQLVGQPKRESLHVDLDLLRGKTGTRYRLPADIESHAAATDAVGCEVATGGSLYPDHVIFLGVGSVGARPAETADDVAARLGYEPVSILFPGEGVLMRADANASADAMARCLADVVRRVPSGAPIRYLTKGENYELTDWDAEKYRQQLAAAKDRVVQ